MSKVYTENQKRVKELFCKERGAWKWNETWETILDLNEHILEAYSTLSSLPHKRGRISEKVIGMIYVAIDGACTHMHIPGMRNHMKHGLEALDITPEEFLEVLAISSLLGVATYTEGFPVLVEEFKKAGLAAGGELEEKQIALKDRFIAEHQYWNDNLELGLAIDPEMFECYADYLKAAFAKKALDPKTREIIFLACNAAPSAVNKADIGRHIRRALEVGVTKEEIVEVFAIVCCQGIHTITLGIPALNDAMGERRNCNGL